MRKFKINLNIVVPIVLTLLPEKKSDVNLNPAIEESS